MLDNGYDSRHDSGQSPAWRPPDGQSICTPCLSMRTGAQQLEGAHQQVLEHQATQQVAVLHGCDRHVLVAGVREQKQHAESSAYQVE